MPKVMLYPGQKSAIDKMHNGCILCGGVGSGKSITSLAYFFTRILGGGIRDDGSLSSPTCRKDLFIITTAHKRDTGEWESECERFGMSSEPMNSLPEVDVTIDSWNNIAKYEGVHDAFFIFDEQRVVGNGSWVKSFLRITKHNEWVLLSATPGDTWLDYIPVFVANGFYKNRSEFLRQHAVFSRYTKYPKVDRFIQAGTLEYYRRQIMVNIDVDRKTEQHWISVPTEYDPAKYRLVMIDRWDPYEQKPIDDITQCCYLMRRVVNSDQSRYFAARKLIQEHDRTIIFYNFDYELEILRKLKDLRCVAEWNGHRHDPVPSTKQWVYLVQYLAGAEGWNCTDTDTIIFYSQNYSYRMMTQAAGRIDRLNTSYRDLYYYVLKSNASIDVMIARALNSKKNFNERAFYKKMERDSDTSRKFPQETDSRRKHAL